MSYNEWSFSRNGLMTIQFNSNVRDLPADIRRRQINEFRTTVNRGQALTPDIGIPYTVFNSAPKFDMNEELSKDELFESIKQIEAEFNSCEIEGDVKRKPVNKEDAMTSKESYYYWIRKQYNELSDKSTIESSSYFIFLNKTGFRGMYREGPNGYNIPYGNYKNPKILEKDEIDYISKLIKNVNFYNSDFSKSIENIQEENNFIYLDPPYAPENDKSFVGYTKDGFDIKQHKLLFELTKKISDKNMIMMSNANVKLIRDNLSPDDYKYEVVSCRRAINSKNPGAKTEEVIITNY